MKKGLSVLLIAAALFGFYGGATNLNDVLACKDYFESASGASDDMQRLEDGLNQLKDNEQAYLDGQVALADGQKALADAEVQLADGEKQLAEGRKTLAKGEADYKAAPAKLAAGEKALADGKKELADGKKSYKDLTQTLIPGLKTAQKHGTSTTDKHDKYWHDGFSHTVSNSVLKQMAAGKKTSDSPGLKQARQVITQTLANSQDDVALIEGLVGTKGIVNDAKNAKSYKAFDKAMNKAYKAFDGAQKQLEEIIKMAEQYAGKIDGMLDSRLATNDTGVPQSADMNAKQEFTNTVPFNACNLKQLQTGSKVLEGVISTLDEKITGMQNLSDGIAQLEAAKEAAGGTLPPEMQAKLDALNQQKAKIEADNGGIPLAKLLAGTKAKRSEAATSKGLLDNAVSGRQQAQKMLQGVLDKYGDKFQVAAKGNKDFASLYGLMQAIANNVIINPETGAVVGSDEPNKAFYGYVSTLKDGLTEAADTLNEKLAVVKSSKKSFSDWDNGYKTLAYAKNGYYSEEYPDDLASKVKGIPAAFQNMVTNKTIKSAIKKYDPSLMKILKKYAGDKGKTRLANEDLDKFDEDITYLGNKVIPRALKVLAKVKANAEKQLADGKKQLAEGEATLAQGYKDYEAAPAKLADGRKQLAEGEAKLAEGYAQYEDGKKQLEDGKAQLAVYEDGEQQVRDGLATLVGTEPMGNVQGIADRIGNDTDFDNGDSHLELDEGLSAVEAGKGYASDLTEAVTAEIKGRAVGTGLLLGAGALAVLAAILSFLKKNKGAGTSAVLSAIAGCAGALMGNGAGTQFSSIAGSAIGATPWVAAGILAAVAAVHAIVHFAPKKEAK